LFSNLFINSSLGELTSWVYKKYSYPILVTDLEEQGKFKKGRACSESILGLFATGDASIEAAKDNNNAHSTTKCNTRVIHMREEYLCGCVVT